MKKALFIVLIFMACNFVYAQDAKINWISLEEAQKLNEKEPRKIMIDVYTDWCGPCKLMMKNTFTNQEIINFINANYYAVKFNGQGPNPVIFKGKTYSNPNFNEKLGTRTRNSSHQFNGVLGTRAYPTLVFFDEKLNIIKNEVGYKTPDKLLPILRNISAN